MQKYTKKKYKLHISLKKIHLFFHSSFTPLRYVSDSCKNSWVSIGANMSSSRSANCVFATQKQTGIYPIKKGGCSPLPPTPSAGINGPLPKEARMKKNQLYYQHRVCSSVASYSLPLHEGNPSPENRLLLAPNTYYPRHLAVRQTPDLTAATASDERTVQ